MTRECLAAEFNGKQVATKQSVVSKDHQALGTKATQRAETRIDRNNATRG